MILVHSVRGEQLYINPNLIETIRSTPDTVLFLTTNKRIPVKDTPQELVERIIEFQHRIRENQLCPWKMIEDVRDRENEKQSEADDSICD